MECKVAYKNIQNSSRSRINGTKVECKVIHVGSLSAFTVVLMEPKWNVKNAP